jgi:hypothetical protein
MVNNSRNIIKKWIDDLKDNYYSRFGKKTFVFDNLKNYDIIHIQSFEFMNKKELAKKITTRLKGNNILSMLKQDKKEKIIVITEIDSINDSSFSRIMNEFFIPNKRNKLKIEVPLICIGTGSCLKKIKDFSKQFTVIKFDSHKENEQTLIIDEYLKEYNIKMELKLKKYIIKYCNNDIRKIKNIIKFIYNDYETKYTYKKYKEYVDTIMNTGNNEVELYEVSKNIFKDDNSIDDILTYYNLEKILLPLMIHQNYTNILEQNEKDNLQFNNKLLEISNILITTDILHEYIFNKYYWDLQNNYAILSCYVPSQLIKNNLNNKIICPKTIKFTNILTKSSLKIINDNKYNYLLRKISSDFDDIKMIYIAKQIITFIFKQDVKEIQRGIDLLKKYNLTHKDIFKLIRITKDDYFLEKYNNNKKIIRKIEKLF